jgi:hypothetical protein
MVGFHCVIGVVLEYWVIWASTITIYCLDGLSYPVSLTWQPKFPINPGIFPIKLPQQPILSVKFPKLLPIN